MEHIEQPISDPHITSSVEIEEKRMETEKAAVDQVMTQINIMVEETTERDEQLIRETKCLEAQIASVEISIRALTALESHYTEQSREELKQLKHLYNELNEKIPFMMHLHRALEHKRGENNAALHADPIFALILEEGRLTQRLEEMGIHVHPPSHPKGQLE